MSIGIGIEVVVAIQESDIASLGSIYAGISRRTQPAVFLMDDMYATVACRPFIAEAWTIIG